MQFMLRFIFLLLPLFLSAQIHTLTNEKIWSGEFRQNYLNAFSPMKGDLYSLLNYNPKKRSSSIDLYDYLTSKKEKTILNSEDFETIDSFDSYRFNDSETSLLIATKTKSIYRHSSESIFYVYHIASKQLIKLSEEHVQEPSFSKDNKQIAYIKNNNIFVMSLLSGITKQVTFDGEKNHIINGISDWVYEEEFGFVKAYEWSPKSEKIIFLKFNETAVQTFSLHLLNGNLYPESKKFKYPKAGEENSKVSLHIVNINSNKTKTIELKNYEYISSLKWTSKANVFAVTTLNRKQNILKLYAINCDDYSKKLLLTEKSETYIDSENNTDLHFLKDNSFIMQNEKNGFNHLYHFKSNGILKQQITKGNWEVTKFYGIDKKENKLYYQSTEDGSINRTIYSISLNGKNKKRIGLANGTSDAEFSYSKKYAIINHSDANTPLNYSLFNGKKIIKEIQNNKVLLEKLSPYKLPKKVFSILKTENGSFNMWMIKPSDFSAEKTYPLLMVQYSGPGSQTVTNSWNSYNDFWYQLLAQNGYIVACIDGRGTGAKGSEFKKSTYKNLGKLETIDQIDTAKKLGNLSYINEKSIGIWGWSYGGFIASNCILKGSDVFSTAIAIAPVTSWRFYDTIYTERYMQTPKDNPEGYELNSPIYYADKLRGNFLIIHGSGDDNVHLQNTYEMTNALIKANKPFEQAIYPDRTHGIYKGRNTRLHLFNKMTNYLDKNLK